MVDHSALTAGDILAAVQEFDTVGRDHFLDRYGYEKSSNHYLALNGKVYDSKAIVAVAHKYRTGAELQAVEFSDSDSSTGRLLSILGFDVLVIPRLDWTRSELIIVCYAVVQNNWKEIKSYDPRAVEISRILRSVSPYPNEFRRSEFRSPDSVQLKSANIATSHPQYGKKKTRGGFLDGVVLEEFIQDPNRMAAIASELRARAESRPTENTIAEPDLQYASAIEGTQMERQHLIRERDPRLRADRIDLEIRRNGMVACEACGFNFEVVYGERGNRYIECHHTMPLSVSGVRETSIADLALLCSNCHRMIHVRPPWLSVHELRALIEQRRAQSRV